MDNGGAIDPTATVAAFLERVDTGLDGFAAAVRRWFTPQTVWENVGMSLTTGPDEALTVIDGMKTAGIAAMRVENLAVAAVGNRVLTERIDYMVDANGNTRRVVRTMGIFEVSETGEIIRWSDYFDTAAFAK